MAKSFGDSCFAVIGKGLNIRWHIGGRGGDGHAGYAGGWFGDGIAVGAEAFDVEVYSFADELFGCFVGWTSYAETRKVWDAAAPAGSCLLEDDSVVHVFCKFTGFGLMDKQVAAKATTAGPSTALLTIQLSVTSLRMTFFIICLLVRREQTTTTARLWLGNGFV